VLPRASVRFISKEPGPVLCPCCESPEDPCQRLRAASREPRPAACTVDIGGATLFVVQVWACGATRVTRVRQYLTGADNVTHLYDAPGQVTVADMDLTQATLNYDG
jgi:hypothetical protein